MDWNKVGQKLTGDAELSSAPTKPDSTITVTGGDFEDQGLMSILQAQEGRGPLHTLERWVDHQVTANTRADLIPNAVLRRMGCHPTVYLGEYAITGLARRPDLFHVTGDDAAKAETMEWLWPRLATLVPQILRAYVYGTAPIVFDWRTRDLEVEVPGGSKSGTRKKTIRNHLHIAASHDLWLDETAVISRDGRTFQGLRHGQTNYPPGRSMLSIWDRSFGSWVGESARRRAAPAWLKSLVFELLQARYLERSVDPPRVIRAPGGTVKDSKGNDVSVQKLIRRIVASLRNGGVASIPHSIDGQGNLQYDIDVMDLPDRSEVWNHALNRFDSQILTAYLVPPGITGAQDVLSGGGARVTENLFGAFLEQLLEFVAGELTQLVEWVWEKNHAKGAPPEVKPNKLPERVQKLHLEILKQVGDGKVGNVVDVNALLDKLDVPLLPDAAKRQVDGPPAPMPGQPGMPGRPRDAAGGRETRREDAETPEGQDDTGAPRGDA